MGSVPSRRPKKATDGWVGPEPPSGPGPQASGSDGSTPTDPQVRPTNVAGALGNCGAQWGLQALLQSENIHLDGLREFLGMLGTFFSGAKGSRQAVRGLALALRWGSTKDIRSAAARVLPRAGRYTRWIASPSFGYAALLFMGLDASMTFQERREQMPAQDAAIATGLEVGAGAATATGLGTVCGSAVAAGLITGGGSLAVCGVAAAVAGLSASGVGRTLGQLVYEERRNLDQRVMEVPPVGQTLEEFYGPETG